MKRLIFPTVLLFALCANYVTAEEAGVPVGSASCGGIFPQDELNLGEETVYVENVFVPKGFDAKDKVEVIASVWTPNPCFSTPIGHVEIVGNDINITVKSSQRANRGRPCIEIAAHHLVSIPVLPVPAGHYNVHVNRETDAPKFSPLEIAVPTHNSIDDFPYAEVDRIEVDAVNKVVTLYGENPSPCIVLDKIIHTSNGLNTYALMPIMRKKDAICPQILTPFAYSYPLPNELHAQKILFHVRTFNGNSKNKMFSLPN